MNKRNRIILIISGVFLALALVFVILGFALAGADVLGWFTSKWAILIYMVLGVWIIIAIYLLVGDKIKSL